MTAIQTPSLNELTAMDNANDEVLVYDASAGEVKRMAPDDFRDGLLSGSAIETCDDDVLTASRAVVTDASGQLAASSITATELGYLSGLTQSIQSALSNFYSPNHLINGDFTVWQRATSFSGIADDTYFADRWIQLSDGDGIIDINKIYGDGTEYFHARAVVATTDKKFGILQILPTTVSQQLRGQTVSLSFRARRYGSSLTSVRAAILVWTSTADSPTSDVVSAWNAADANPTLIANWAIEGSAQDFTIGTDWATFELENIDLDTAGITNIAVFIWSDNTSTTGSDELRITEVNLTIGATAQTFVRQPDAKVYQECYPFYFRLKGDGSGNGPQMNAYAAAGSDTPKTWISFPVEMRTTPTPTVGGTWDLTNCTGPTLTGTSPQGSNLTVTASGAGMCIAVPDSTDDYLEFDAEL